MNKLIRNPISIFILLMIVTAGIGYAAPKMRWGRPGSDQIEADRGSSATWARLQFRVKGGGMGWMNAACSDLLVAQRMREVTHANVPFDWAVPDIGNLDAMCAYPFIFMHDQYTPILTQKERANLREYMLRGGVIFVDDCLGDNPPDYFFRGMMQEMKIILPEAKYSNLASNRNHDIFKCFYKLNGFPSPAIKTVKNGLIAAYYQDRIVALLCSADLHCQTLRCWGVPNDEIGLEMETNLYLYLMSH